MFKKDLGLLMLIIAIGAMVAYINPRFLLPSNISNTANQVGLQGLFAIGEAFVVITGGIELSVGSIIALLGTVFVDLIVIQGVNWGVAVIIILAASMLMGLVHGLLVTKFRMQAFLVTLCGLLIYRGVARYYTNDATAGFGFGVSFPTLEWITTGRSEIFAPFAHLLGFTGPTIAIPHSFIVLLIVTALAGVVVHGSVFGRYLFAVGKNEEAARYSGIRVGRVTVAAYVICCGLTGVAAIFWAMYTRSISPAAHGNSYELYAIAAVVLGGCSLRGGEGSVVGVVLGVILLQVLQNLVNLLGIPSSLNFAVMGSVILIGVFADLQYTQYRQRSLKTHSHSVGKPVAVAAASTK
ncbi:MAG: ABC transporter permease [Bradyrhizobium sp.]|nr:ABC transporter permease [Bradyrhizobium sp.]